MSKKAYSLREIREITLNFMYYMKYNQNLAQNLQKDQQLFLFMKITMDPKK